jgi:hypothetical protein
VIIQKQVDGLGNFHAPPPVFDGIMLMLIYRRYHNFFRKFNKFLSWQAVRLHKPISHLQALLPIEISRFWEGVGVRFPLATRLRRPVKFPYIDQGGLSEGRFTSGSVRVWGCNSPSLLDAICGSGQSQNKMGLSLYKLVSLLILKKSLNYLLTVW